MEKYRLSELLHNELETMEPYQVKMFSQELTRVLPGAIKQAADAARGDGQNDSVNNKEEKRNE